MAYHLYLTLQQRATLSIAISIWNNQKVKDMISKLFGKLRGMEGKVIKEHHWQQLLKEVLEAINPNVLPSQLIGELIHLVKELGKRMHNWYKYVSVEYCNVFGKRDDNIINYISEMYWTPIGTVDKVKILQSYWLKNRKINVGVMYYIACKNTMEDHIDDLWHKMPCYMEFRYDNFYRHAQYDRLYADSYYDHLILAYWKYLAIDQMDQFVEYTQSDCLIGHRSNTLAYTRNYSVEHNMFLLSVFHGYSSAAQYFWQKLTQQEKDRSLVNSAHMAVDRSSVVNELDDTRGYKKEMYVEILIFLINQMTVNQKQSFLSAGRILDEISDDDVIERDFRLRVLSMLLYIWPWQEYFLPVLKDVWQYLEHHKSCVRIILLKISQKNVEPSYDVASSKLQSILREVWFIIPRSIKQKIQDDISICSNFIVNLLKAGALDNVKMIFDDPDIADVRMQYIRIGQKGYESLIERNKYETLEQIMEEILRSEEEKRYLKSTINDTRVCKQFITTGDYDSVDKFLNWQFETEERKKQFKNDFYWKRFFMEWSRDIFKRSNGSVDEAKKETSRLLKWMFESEEDMVSFKKELLFKSELVIRNKILRDPIQMTKPQAYQLRQILEESFL